MCAVFRLSKTAATITTLSTALAAVLLMVSSVCAGERIPLPDDLFYYQPAASVRGAEAVWTNPAGLARAASEAQFLFDYSHEKVGKSWGTLLNRRYFATAFRNIYLPQGGDFEEVVFGFGAPLEGRTSLGISYRYFREGPGVYNNRHFWNIALQGVPSPRVAWGAVLGNLNRGRVDGERSQMEMRYSLGYRPLSNSRLTFAADMSLGTGTRIGDADYTYYVEGVPRPGVYLRGSIDSHRNFEFGFRVNLLKYFVGGRSSYARGGDHRITTGFIGVTSMRQPTLIPEPRRRLRASVSGRPAENPPRPILGSRQTSFLDLILEINRAADDPSIGEMVLSLSSLKLGMGQAQELREALRHFRSRDKRVVCHIDYPNNVAYFVACAADRIVIPPVSRLGLVGLRAELTFYAGTLEKVGARLDFVRVGDHKTATEHLTRRSSSDIYRAQVNRLLDELYDQFVAAIADGRGLSPDSVRALVDNGPYTSVEAQELGLVDGLSYRDDLSRSLLPRRPEVSFRRYRSDTLQSEEWGRRPVIAVIAAEGEITSGQAEGLLLASGPEVTPENISRGLAQMKADRDVRGVVLRVNSPGGWALAGERIHHGLTRATRGKPMVVSMSNVAASGGYYIATPARTVFANPATVTGSIGIYGGKLDLSGLYGKIDLTKELYTRGKFSAMMTTARPFTEEEREKYQSMIDAFYGHFVMLVSESRGLGRDSVDALGRGRVWTGREAVANGLVDQLGGFQASVSFLADRLGLEDYRVRILPEDRPLFLWPGWTALGSVTRMIAGGAADLAGVLDPEETSSDVLLTRMPFDITVE